jgi:hypothetical protein
MKKRFKTPLILLNQILGTAKATKWDHFETEKN